MDAGVPLLTETGQISIKRTRDPDGDEFCVELSITAIVKNRNVTHNTRVNTVPLPYPLAPVQMTITFNMFTCGDRQKMRQRCDNELLPQSMRKLSRKITDDLAAHNKDAVETFLENVRRIIAQDVAVADAPTARSVTANAYRRSASPTPLWTSGTWHSLSSVTPDLDAALTATKRTYVFAVSVQYSGVLRPGTVAIDKSSGKHRLDLVFENSRNAKKIGTFIINSQSV